MMVVVVLLLLLLSSLLFRQEFRLAKNERFALVFDRIQEENIFNDERSTNESFNVQGTRGRNIFSRFPLRRGSRASSAKR